MSTDALSNAELSQTMATAVVKLSERLGQLESKLGSIEGKVEDVKTLLRASLQAAAENQKMQESAQTLLDAED
eukprot:m.153016 g.153016  ORF g.153016 m.153016 type:complete len:73 (+) comp14277_c1_seq1:314-532(+)